MKETLYLIKEARWGVLLIGAIGSLVYGLSSGSFGLIASAVVTSGYGIYSAISHINNRVMDDDEKGGEA